MRFPSPPSDQPDPVEGQIVVPCPDGHEHEYDVDGQHGYDNDLVCPTCGAEFSVSAYELLMQQRE